MKEYIPDYYKQFQCVADQCKDSCCIGWEIMIDPESYEKYQKLEGNFQGRLMKGIEHGDNPVFHLDHRDRCVFLNKENLCDIYIHLGEDALCEICTQHPRFHNEYGNIRQSGLGMSCEEAARLLFASEELKLEITTKGTSEEKCEDFSEKILKIQLWLLDLLKNKEYSIEERIEQIFDIVKAIQDQLNMTGEIVYEQYETRKKYHILQQMSEENYIKNWISIYQQLDFMDPQVQQIFYKMEKMPFHKERQKMDDAYIEHLMSYFVYRYFMKSCEDDNLVDKIKFAILNCLMIEKMNEYCQEHNILKSPVEIARIYSKEIEYSQENMDTIFEELLFD